MSQLLLFVNEASSKNLFDIFSTSNRTEKNQNVHTEKQNGDAQHYFQDVPEYEEATVETAEMLGYQVKRRKDRRVVT